VSELQQQEAAQFATLSAPPPTAVVASQEDAVVRAAAVAPAPDLPPYQVYVVQDGDTVSTIAARFGISSEYVVANNAEISDSDFLVVGQTIIVPAGDGILHEVRYGETLSDIAARYDVDLEAITSFRSNNIATPDDITETQLVFVPGGQVPAPAPVAEPVPEETAPPEDGSTEEPDDGGSSGGGGGIVRTGPQSGAGLIWPLGGPVSSYMGPGHPLGIDIDAFNLAGAAVAASTSGTVVFAGGNACCSYGLYVVIVSPEGIETLYAHLDSIYVSQGQSVSQGEAIGVVGSTGYSTGRHLHFEVIDNGVRQNPLNYLP
jgi:murein DD-endopeptidase MepM/ murein hydrolase activator NlpD